METDQLVTLPSIVSGLVVEKLAHYVFVESKKLGFRLQWEGYDYIHLEVNLEIFHIFIYLG